MLQMKKSLKWGLVSVLFVGVLFAVAVGGYMYKMNVYRNDIVPPALKVSQTEKTITIEADDKSGILHIGYCWDDQETTAVEKDHEEIPIPEAEGPHTLHCYAKDKSRQINATGWLDYTVVVQPKAQ